jgi:hypothetical protein
MSLLPLLAARPTSLIYEYTPSAAPDWSFDKFTSHVDRRRISLYSGGCRPPRLPFLDAFLQSPFGAGEGSFESVTGIRGSISNFEFDLEFGFDFQNVPLSPGRIVRFEFLAE